MTHKEVCKRRVTSGGFVVAMFSGLASLVGRVACCSSLGLFNRAHKVPVLCK
jgi:hypothetical protein